MDRAQGSGLMRHRADPGELHDAACLFSRAQVGRMCLMCGYVRPCVRVQQGYVCRPCVSVCVEVTVDKLAGAMTAEEERNAA